MLIYFHNLSGRLQMEYVIDKNKVHAILEKKNIKTQLELAGKSGMTKN